MIWFEFFPESNGVYYHNNFDELHRRIR
jgi:hypothetical protein